MRDRSSSRSPFANLPPRSQRPLVILGALSVGKAVALIVLAQAIAMGVVSAIQGTDRLALAATLGIAAAIVRALLVWLTQIVAERAAVGAREELRHELAERALIRGGRDLPLGIGALTTLATRGLDALGPYFTQYLPTLTSALVVPLLVGIWILLADWVSALIILLTLPLIPVFMILIGLQTADRARDAADAIARLSDHLVELARGLPVLVGLGRAQEQTATLREVAEGVRRRTMTTLRIAFLSSLALELIATISVAVVAVFIGVRLVHGQLDLETGLLILILAPECYLPFRQVGAAHHASEDGLEALTRVRAIIATPVTTSPIVPPRDAAQPVAIAVRGLTIRHADRTEPIVRDLGFTIAPGELIALSGPSGAGKTTVLAALAGLLGEEAQGEITGVDPTRIAWVSQHPATFAMTVHEEIALALETSAPAAVTAILTRVQAAHLAARHPGELSPGELRRVALGRALARIERGATLLLLDEPTAHLDPETAQLITSTIASLRGSVTIVLVAHDATVARLADRTIALGDGLTPADLPTTQPVIAAPPAARVDDTSRPEHVATDASVWRALIAMIQPWRPRFLVAVTLGVLASLASVALTSVSAWLIVRASEQPPILYLMVAIVGVRFFGIGRALLRYGERLWLHDAIFASLTELRVRIWATLARRGPASRQLLRGEETLDRLIGDVDDVRDLAPRVVLPPLVGILTAIVAIVVLTIMLPLAGLVMLAGSVVAVIIAPLVARWADRRASVAETIARSGVLRRFAALLGAAPDLRVNGLGDAALAEIDALDREASDAARRGAWALGLGNALVTLGCGITALVMLIIGTDAVRDGVITGKVLAVLVLTPLALIDPFTEVTEAIQRWPALRTVVQRLAPFVERVEPEIVATEDLPAIASLTLDDVTAGWSVAEAPVFTGLDARVATGGWLVVTGPSGSGKSTLLAVLLGFLRPRAGRYLLNDIDTATLPPSAIARGIAWCPQEAHLFDSSLRANLLVARAKDDAPSDDELTAMLERVGLGDLLATLPDGLATRIGSQGSRLSGGERTRVAIARALLTRADVLLLDEPTAHLDRATADALLEDLRQSLTDVIVVMVTHHLDEIVPTDVRIRLDGAPATELIGAMD